MGGKQALPRDCRKAAIAWICLAVDKLLWYCLWKDSGHSTVLVANAPTETAAEGEKAKYMSALNSTVASVPAGEHAFVLTDANARTGKRGEGGGEIDSKALGANGRDVVNENGKLLLRFAEDNKLTLLNTFFCTP